MNTKVAVEAQHLDRGRGGEDEDVFVQGDDVSGVVHCKLHDLSGRPLCERIPLERVHQVLPEVFLRDAVRVSRVMHETNACLLPRCKVAT